MATTRTRVGAFLRSALLLATLASVAHAAGVDDTTRVQKAAKWDDLSKQIIPKIIENNGDAGSAIKQFSKVSYTLELRMTTTVASTATGATFSYAWHDKNNNGILSDDEIEVEVLHTAGRGMGAYAREVVRTLRHEAANSTFNIFSIHDCKARRQGETYIMELRPIEGRQISEYMAFDKMYLVVNAQDHRITNFQAKTYEGATITAQYQHVRLGDKWVKSGYIQETTQPSGEIIRETRQNQWASRDGCPIPQGTVLEHMVTTGYGSIGTRQEYTVANWQGVKREVPLPDPGSTDWEKLFTGAEEGGAARLFEDDGADEGGVGDLARLFEDEGAAGGQQRDAGGPFEDEGEAEQRDQGDAGGLFEDEGAAQDDDLDEFVEAMDDLLFEEEQAPPRPQVDLGTKELGDQIVAKLASCCWNAAKVYDDTCVAGLELKEAGGRLLATATVEAGASPLFEAPGMEIMLALPYMYELHYGWNLVVVGPLYRAGGDELTYTAKQTDDGFILYGADEQGVVKDQATLSLTFAVREREAQLPDRNIEGERLLTFQFDVREVEGITYLKKVTMQSRPVEGGPTDARTWTYTYSRRHGVPFVQTIKIEATVEGQKIEGVMDVAELHIDE